MMAAERRLRRTSLLPTTRAPRRPQMGLPQPKPSLPAVPGFGQPSEQPSGSETQVGRHFKLGRRGVVRSIDVRQVRRHALPDRLPPIPTRPRIRRNEPGPKSGRFLTPQERLSKELPDWFLEKDVNGDGQVDMAEYASEWTPDLVDEFNRYDLNHDGIITAAECLKAGRLTPQIEVSRFCTPIVLGCVSSGSLSRAIRYRLRGL